MSHIFISYSKKNSDYAYALADFLQAQGFNIWIDHIGIEYGVGWWDAIVEGLDICAAFIVVMTPESKASDWVQREVFIALQEKKPIFPLLLNGDNWKVFVLTQYADVRDGSMPDGDLLKRLSHYVTPRGKGANKSNLTPEKQASSPPPPAPRFDVDQAIGDFGKVFRVGNWSEALNILGRIRASGQDPTPFDPDEFEQRVQMAIEDEKRQHEQEAYEAERTRQYGRVLAMAAYADADTVWAALQKVWQTFPDYDPGGLALEYRLIDKFQLPMGSIEERESLKVWPGQWINAAKYLYRLSNEYFNPGAHLNLPGDAEKGKPCFSIGSGVVTYSGIAKHLSGSPSAFGTLVVIRHDLYRNAEHKLARIWSRYAHVKDILVKTGQRVSCGEQIATIWGTASTGLLYFDLCISGIVGNDPAHWPKTEQEVLDNYIDPEWFYPNVAKL